MNKKLINQNQLLNNSNNVRSISRKNKSDFNQCFIYVNVSKRQSMYRCNILLNVFNYPINLKQLSINHSINVFNGTLSINVSVKHSISLSKPDYLPGT